MICACGTRCEGLCPDCGRQNLACPACGGSISADPSAVILSCPYCDSTMAEPDAREAPPYFPVNVSERAAGEQLLRFCLNRYGIPRGFERSFAVQQARLVYVPIYLFTVTARLSATVHETDTCAVPGVRSPWYRDALCTYRFAMRVRQVVDPDKLPGLVLAHELTPSQAEDEARRFGSILMARDRARFAEVQDDAGIHLVDEGQVFYPLFELTYRHGWRTFRGVVDASNGAVCTAEHPVSLGSRALVLLAAGVMLVTTFVISFTCFLPVLSGEGLVMLAAVAAALVTLATGGLGTLRLVWAAIRAYRTGEEQEQHEHALDVVDLTARCAVTDRRTLP